MMHTIGMDDSAKPAPDAALPEQSHPREERDVYFRNLGRHAQFVADIVRFAFAKGQGGSTRPPGTKNLVVLLSRVVSGSTLETFTDASEALAGRLDELGDVKMERDFFQYVRAEGKEMWPELDWFRCESMAELVRLLRESEITWPEKWKEQVRPEVEADVLGRDGGQA